MVTRDRMGMPGLLARKVTLVPKDRVGLPGLLATKGRLEEWVHWEELDPQEMQALRESLARLGMPDLLETRDQSETKAR